MSDVNDYDALFNVTYQPYRTSEASLSAYDPTPSFTFDGEGAHINPFGFAPGEEIGIRDPIDISLGRQIFSSWFDPWWIPRWPGGSVFEVPSSPSRYEPVTIPAPARPTGNGELPGIYGETSHAPEDWEAIYDQVVILNNFPDQNEAPYPGEEVEEVPSFWDIAGAVVDIFDDDPSTVTIGQGAPAGFQTPYGFAPTTTIPSGAGGTFTIDPKTGKVKKCGRRRRRRLLTESDFNDLMRISTLPNKETVRVALAKAVGRSR